MKRLIKSDEWWGDAKIHETNPNIDVENDVIFIPFNNNKNWGVFRADLTRVDSTIDYRQGSLAPSDQADIPPPETISSADSAPHGTYIYAGRFNPHYGHFIVNTLPRFWAIAAVRSPSTPIVYHGGGSPADWFRLPFVATIFELLGLHPTDFVHFDRPTKLRNLIIPSTSLEEQHAGYRAFSELCRGIGQRILSRTRVDTNSRPLYYSKTRLKSAVGVVVNEDEIEKTLISAGIDIVYPETLSFVEQVVLMSSRDNIIGTSGSFLHTSIFCPSRKITCLSVAKQINTNYVIIDKLNENDSEYYYSEDIQVVEHDGEFLTARYLPNASEVTDELLSAMAAR